MLETGQWPEELTIDESDLSLAEELKKLSYHSDVTRQHDDDDIACLNKAVQFEIEAADFYFSLAKKPRARRKKRSSIIWANWSRITWRPFEIHSPTSKTQKAISPVKRTIDTRRPEGPVPADRGMCRTATSFVSGTDKRHFAFTCHPAQLLHQKSGTNV